MKNSAHLRGVTTLTPPKICRSNSSYPTKAEFNNCFITHSKHFLVFPRVSPFRSLFFCSPGITQLRPQVFSVNCSITCSGLHFWRHVDVIGSIWQNFRRHRFNMTKFFPNMVNTMQLVNQKRRIFWMNTNVINLFGQHTQITVHCHALTSQTLQTLSLRDDLWETTSLFQFMVNSSWLWWIMRVVLTNQKRGNILNE